MNTIIYYHDNCLDGIVAAWAASKKYGFTGNQYIGCVHAKLEDIDINKLQAEVSGRNVVFVDFSYPKDVMQGIANCAKSLLVLDHHKTAKADLDGLSGEAVTIVFDLERSGAGITWDALIGVKRPLIVDHVEDRDLWRFNLPNTKAVCAYLYNKLIIGGLGLDGIEECVQAVATGTAVKEGESMLKLESELVERLVRDNCYETEIAGGTVVTACNSPLFMSEIGNKICAGTNKIALVFYVKGDESHCSLRSDKELGPDVSVIAKHYGGGGHRNAAGYMVKTINFD